jgi:hypothetical protein
MKAPTPASLKKVNAENLAKLGSERLAQILTDVAATRPDLKRRLRMELAAEQGPEHLAAEIDKRLVSLESSRGKIGWRQRPAFVRDLDALRGLITGRLADLDRSAALGRIWQFMDTARQVAPRLRDREGTVEAVFAKAAADAGGLIVGLDPQMSAIALVDAVVRNPSGWIQWLPEVLSRAPEATAQAALRLISERRGAVPGWMSLIRQLADAAGEVDAYRATFTREALETPAMAAEVAHRYLVGGRIDEAGEILKRAAPQSGRPGGRDQVPNFDWETAWIDYLDRKGRSSEAQAVRWASFERSLSAERARTFIGRLADFDDVEAEARALDYARGHANFEAALRFLMEWPTLVDAARLIQARPDDIKVSPEDAELWASKLRLRQPQAAHTLLRKAAAAAFGRRDFKTCDRLTTEADSIEI